jgi:peroxiredoxin
LAAQVETLWAAEKKDEAKKALQTLQKISASIDIRVPAFARLNPISKELGIEGDWRQPLDVAKDIGERPSLDALGPFRWQPVEAPLWQLADLDNKERSLKDYRGKPVVVIFYLGAGCLHCAKQLQTFAPKADEFRDVGLEIVAISTDTQPTLVRANDDLEIPIPFPLVSDSELTIFRAYRCYDDFEKQTLHGTFLIDGQGRIRWQDISYEPFMDADFILKESVRLLSQDAVPASDSPQKVTELR